MNPIHLGKPKTLSTTAAAPTQEVGSVVGRAGGSGGGGEPPVSAGVWNMGYFKGILKEYIPESWYHEKGIYKVLAKLLPRLPDVKGCLFLTLTVDPKFFSDPAEAYEDTRQKIRKVFYALRKGVWWEGKLYKIKSPYCVKTEFHENGFAHFHLIFLTRKFLPADLLNHLWGYGRTEVKRISNDDFHYLLKYVTKAGELPEWVKKRLRLRVFQPSHGFLKAVDKLEPEKKEDDDEQIRKRASYLIGERLERWQRMATFVFDSTHENQPKGQTLYLSEPFKTLFDHLVYPVALDGRYQGNGQIQINNRKDMYPWILNQNPHPMTPASSFAVRPFQMRPPSASEKTESAGSG